jgi:hypothetical protein
MVLFRHAFYNIPDIGVKFIGAQQQTKLQKDETLINHLHGTATS